MGKMLTDSCFFFSIFLHLLHYLFLYSKAHIPQKSGSASAFRYQHVGIGNAKVSRWGYCQMRTANSFEQSGVAVEYRLIKTNINKSFGCACIVLD